MKEGTYQFIVYYFNKKTGWGNGFTAELEIEGNVYSFDCRNLKLAMSENNVRVVNVEYKNGEFKVIPFVSHETQSQDLWGLTTNKFHKVSTVMTSPNYWDGQSEKGNKHYFFMLEGCVNNEEPNSFYNEYLNSELSQHRRVMEALGGMMKVEDTTNQLSGLGFSVGKRSELLVKVTGAFTRMLKIKF